MILGCLDVECPEIAGSIQIRTIVFMVEAGTIIRDNNNVRVIKVELVKHFDSGRHEIIDPVLKIIDLIIGLEEQ